MADHRQGNYRGSHFSSETLKAMEQHERKRDSQTRSQGRLKRKRLARQRKLEGHEGNIPEPTISAIGPQRILDEPMLPTVEAPQSLVARFWGFLRILDEPKGETAEHGGRKEALH